MKRIKNINQEICHKSWHTHPVTPLALVISAVFIMSGCEKNDETIAIYQNVDDCLPVNTTTQKQCTTPHYDTLTANEKNTPEYASPEDCITTLGPTQRTEESEHAGITTGSQGSNSWMPLIAGYMMGHVMGGSGFAKQPPFTSSNITNLDRGKFVDANGKNNDTTIANGHTTNTPKRDITPDSLITHTTTRGGFGETISKHNSMKSRSTVSSSRSMGG